MKNSRACPRCGHAVEFHDQGAATLREVTGAWSREREKLIREIDALRRRLADGDRLEIRRGTRRQYDISVSNGLRQSVGDVRR